MARHERFLVFLSLTTRFCIFCIFSWHRLANLIQLPEKGMSHLAFIIRVADQFLRCLLSHLKFLSLWIETHTNQLAWTDTLWHENICPENGKQWTHKRWWCIEGEHIHIPIKFQKSCRAGLQAHSRHTTAFHCYSRVWVHELDLQHKIITRLQALNYLSSEN